MTLREIWSIAGAIITSVGGASVIICAVSKFFAERIAKHIDAKYEQRLNKELEKYKASLDGYRHITKAQFDREFDIYHNLSKSFFTMIVKLSSFADNDFELEDSLEDGKKMIVDNFIHMINTTSSAQNELYENAAFIPKDIFEKYDTIYEKANDLFWLFESRMRDYTSGKIEYSELVTEKDKGTVKELKEELLLVNSTLREYLKTLMVVAD